jgi:PPM family protein phosphatase
MLKQLLDKLLRFLTYRSKFRLGNDTMISFAKGLSDRGVVRAVNQDNYFIDPDGRFFIVADGMGGHAGGEEASRIAIEVASKYLDSHWDSNSATPNLVETAFMAANDAIVRDQDDNPQRADMGTTIVAALFRESKFWSAHVGDSRFYRMRDGSLKQLTEDDTWVARAMKMGQLTADEARTHPLRHVLSHCLGRRDLRQVTIDSQDIRSGDILLLCSDGLTEEVDDDEIGTILQCRSLEELPGKLVEAAKNNGGSDNITTIAVSIGAVEANVTPPPPTIEATDAPEGGAVFAMESMESSEAFVETGADVTLLNVNEPTPTSAAPEIPLSAQEPTTADN